MLKYKLLFLLLLYSTVSTAQSGFHCNTTKDKIVIQAQFINNLVIIPLEINGVKLNFLLDTGVKETVLFSLEDSNSINFSNIESIEITGFGKKDPFLGYRSVDNKVSINGYTDENHTLYLVLDEDINISSQLGVTVNGIIGYYFFENYPIQIDYQKHQVIVYNTVSKKWKKKLETKYTSIPLTLDKGKPYIAIEKINDVVLDKSKNNFLVDTGNGDAFWVFHHAEIKIPEKTISDYLGKGASGEVYGLRGRLKEVKLGTYNIKEPIVAFPDSLYIQNINSLSSRKGSVGGELLSRFNLVFDYQKEKLYVKPNKKYQDPFQYNMSGIEIGHQGLEWVQEKIQSNLSNSKGEKVIQDFSYKFDLKPIFVITAIRPNSPAEKAGIQKGDIIKSINGTRCYNYSLQKINEMLKEEDGKTIRLEINRKNIELEINFKLEKIL